MNRKKKKKKTDLEHIDVIGEDEDFNVEEIFKMEMFT